MKKKIFIFILIVILGVFVGASVNTLRFSKNSSLPAEGNYKTINEVNGVSFIVNTNIMNKATAVSEISEKINIDPELLYLYKDGKENYLLFGLNNIVVAVEKGTEFPLHKDMTDLDIESASVCGIWFEQSGLKLQADYESNAVTFEVIGGLNISNNLYTDYVGKLKILSDGEEQWAIFCGIPGADKYKNLSDNAKKGIDTIVSSLVQSDYVAPTNEEVYAVRIDNAQMQQTAESDAEQVTPSPATTPSAEVKESEEASVEDTEEDVTEVKDEAEPSEEVSEDVAEDDEATEDVEVAEEPVGEPEPTEEIEEPTPTPEPEPAYIAEKEKTTVDRGSSVQLDNQKLVMNKKSNEAYSSDIYSMLSLKDNGIIGEFDIHTKQIVTPIINISRIYKGKTAVDMIKEYCKETGDYDYFDAPIGCEWHVAEYSLLYKNCATKPYINIKLRGIDGNNLVHKGIKYTKRTYDMFNKAEWNGDYYGVCYCYYAVPIDVKEYALECGLGTVTGDTGSQAAYYHIKY